MCPWEVELPQAQFICSSKPASSMSLWMEYPSGHLLVGQRGFKCMDGNFPQRFTLPRRYLPDALALPAGPTLGQNFCQPLVCFMTKCFRS